MKTKEVQKTYANALIGLFIIVILIISLFSAINQARVDKKAKEIQKEWGWEPAPLVN